MTIGYKARELKEKDEITYLNNKINTLQQQLTNEINYRDIGYFKFGNNNCYSYDSTTTK
jgi:hypothetical protein